MPNKNDYDVNDRLWKNEPLFLKKKSKICLQTLLWTLAWFYVYEYILLKYSLDFGALF